MATKHPDTIEEYDENKRNGTVIVKLGAEWCYPCKKLEPFFDELSKKFLNITFISVDMDMLGEHNDTSDVKTIPMIKSFINGKRLPKHFKGSDEKLLELYINWVSTFTF